MAGKGTAKKDLGAMARAYGHVYVAQVAFGARDTQTVKAFVEADAHPGPSLIIAYSPCIAHGYDLAHGLDQQKLAVDSGYWPLYRFDPRRAAAGDRALVLDTEVYSNTGGQQSKATPIGAAAKFAVAGKGTGKKDLGAMARAYGHVYVAQVASGARDTQTVKAFVEADAHPGPSLIIAYSPCIAHGYDLAHGLDQQKLAVDSGYWPLYRFDPRRATAGARALVLDSGAPKVALEQFTRNETRFRLVEQQDPARARELSRQGQAAIRTRFAALEDLARPADPPAPAGAPGAPAIAEH